MAGLSETEVKLYVPDLEAVKARVEAAGGVLSAPRVFERNVRYDNAQGWLSEKGSVLRLRWDTRARLTYKDGKRVAGQHGSTRFEAEVEVSDFDTMEIILSKLGYEPVFIYEKYRTTYELDGTEVTLDELPYGDFVEIEGEDSAIGRVVSLLDLQGAHRFDNSYSVLFTHVKRNLGLAFDHLTFENFNGMTISEDAFAGAD